MKEVRGGDPVSLLVQGDTGAAGQLTVTSTQSELSQAVLDSVVHQSGQGAGMTWGQGNS